MGTGPGGEALATGKGCKGSHELYHGATHKIPCSAEPRAAHFHRRNDAQGLH